MSNLLTRWLHCKGKCKYKKVDLYSGYLRYLRSNLLAHKIIEKLISISYTNHKLQGENP